MNRRSRLLRILFVLFPLTMAVGCGEPTADVAGSVTFDGITVDKGMLTFTPSGEVGQSVGAKIENGKFQAVGVYPGENFVLVIATRDVTFSQNSKDMATSAAPTGGRASSPSADLIPPNANGNNKLYSFQAGNNTLDLELTSPKP